MLSVPALRDPQSSPVHQTTSWDRDPPSIDEECAISVAHPLSVASKTAKNMLVFFIFPIPSLVNVNELCGLPAEPAPLRIIELSSTSASRGELW